MSENQENKLAKAKAGLVLDQPFFASLLLPIPIVADESCKTFATNGDVIQYNPKWLTGLTLAETTFVLAHETLHCVFEHMFTRGERTPNRWNQAADYVINDMLVSERIGAMPKGGLLNPQLVQQAKGTTVGVYDLLPDDTEKNQTGDPNGAMDNVGDASQDEAESSAKQAEMKVKVIQARNAAKMAGKLSQGLDRLVKEMTRTETNWREVLRRFLSERAKVDLSYARPKRRFLADDVYLPSLTGEKLGCIAVAVDCSGSIQQSMLEMFQSEIRAILQDVSPSEIQVVYFDAEVTKTQTFGPDDAESLTLSLNGGGGTAFSPVFQHLNQLDVAPVACVVLTDLCCDDFGDVPSYPVLWASTERRDVNSVPFGDVIYLKKE